MLTHIAKTDLFAARTVLNLKALCIFLSLLYSYPKATEKGTENKQVNKILLCLSGQTGQTHTWIYFYLNPFFLSHRAPEAESQSFPSHTYRQHFTALNPCFRNTSRHIPCSQPLSSCTGNLQELIQLKKNIILEEKWLSAASDS